MWPNPVIENYSDQWRISDPCLQSKIERFTIDPFYAKTV